MPELERVVNGFQISLLKSRLKKERIVHMHICTFKQNDKLRITPLHGNPTRRSPRSSQSVSGLADDTSWPACSQQRTPKGEEQEQLTPDWMGGRMSPGQARFRSCCHCCLLFREALFRGTFYGNSGLRPSRRGSLSDSVTDPSPLPCASPWPHVGDTAAVHSPLPELWSGHGKLSQKHINGNDRWLWR